MLCSLRTPPLSPPVSLMLRYRMFKCYLSMDASGSLGYYQEDESMVRGRAGLSSCVCRTFPRNYWFGNPESEGGTFLWETWKDYQITKGCRLQGFL